MAMLSGFHEEFVKTRTPASPMTLKLLKFALEHLLLLTLPREDKTNGGVAFSKAQEKIMQGDPLVSLIVAVYSPVFYNRSSIPNGKMHYDIDRNATAHASEG
jgi:hypothetical protein